MTKQLSAIVLILAALVGFQFSCGSGLVAVNLGPSGGGSVTPTPTPTPAISSLTQVSATITIRQDTGGTDASVTATFSKPNGAPYTLQNGQSVEANGQALTGPTDNHEYTRAIPVATDYQITATEPTQFVKVTSIAPPAAFDITGPAAGATVSLAGFTLTWSNPEQDLQVEFLLRQVINGSESRKTMGPVPDSGTQTFAASDLSAFRWGKNDTLNVTVTKTRTRQGIDGFDNGTLISRLSNTLIVTPGP